MKSISLSALMKKDWFIDSESGASNPRYFLTTGLQNLLIGFATVFVADAFNRKDVLPGFSGKFSNALSNPASGKILEFAKWLASYNQGSSVRQLSSYLNSNEKKQSGWLMQSVQLRNRWFHPKSEAPEKVLDQTVAHLSKTPDFKNLGMIQLADSEDVYWVEENGRHPLYPFFSARSGYIQLFTEYQPPNKLILSEPNPSVQANFQKIWSEIRLLDVSLINPTANDFYAKAQKKRSVYNGEPPWWMDQVLKGGPIAFILVPGEINAFFAHTSHKWPEAASVDIDLKENDTLMELLARQLELAKPPTIKELISFSDDYKNIIFIGIRGVDISWQKFLKTIYWLADLNGEGAPGFLRVFIERKQEQLLSDFEKLQDRLPDSLESLLRRPPKSKGPILKDFQWPLKKPKRFLGIF